MRNFETILLEYNSVKRKIKHLIIKQEELRELYGFPSSSSGGSFSQSKQDFALENFIMKLSDIEEEQKKYEEKLEVLRNELILKIEKLTNLVSKEIFYYKTFSNYSWKEISQKLRYSESRIRQLYNEGVLILNKKC